MTDNPTTGSSPGNRLMQYLRDAAAENAREKAIAPDMDALRWRGMKILFVEFPVEVAKLILLAAGLVLSLFVFCLFIPFLALSPKAAIGAGWFFREVRDRLAEEEERQCRWFRQIKEFHRLWKQRKKEIQNVR